MTNMSHNAHQSKKTKSKRGRKRRTVPEESDLTGRNHFMVVNKQKRRVTEKDANYKGERHLLPTVEKPVDESAQEPVVEHEHTTMVNNSIGRQEFAQMVRFITNKFHVIRTALNTGIFSLDHGGVENLC